MLKTGNYAVQLPTVGSHHSDLYRNFIFYLREEALPEESPSRRLRNILFLGATQTYKTSMLLDFMGAQDAATIFTLVDPFGNFPLNDFNPTIHKIIFMDNIEAKEISKLKYNLILVLEKMSHTPIQTKYRGSKDSKVWKTKIFRNYICRLLSFVNFVDSRCARYFSDLRSHRKRHKRSLCAAA